MLKSAATIFGLVFIVLGIAGFLPALAPGDMLFGIFFVDPLHNVVHLATGVIAVLCGLISAAVSRLFFQVFGVVYGLLAVLGLFVGEGYVLGFLSHNVHILWLHAIIAAVALYLGFGVSARGRTGPGRAA